jgi:hypothetical protein
MAILTAKRQSISPAPRIDMQLPYANKLTVSS